MSPGDIVIAAFPGADATKARPALVLTTEDYHRHHPDVILALITTRRVGQITPTDWEIREWQAAGLHAPSWFRLYLVTLLQRDVRPIGHLTDADWREIRARIQAGINLT